MNKKNKALSVVFLDIDGVVNTRKTCVYAPSGCVGIDEERLAILSNSMKYVGVDGVVLTSTWKTMDASAEDYIYMIEKLDKYGITVLGKTEEERFTEREEGVLKYLNEHPEVEEFVILDDQHFGFMYYNKLLESMLDTQGKGIENSVAASKTPSVAAILFQNAIQKYAKG